MNLSSLISGLSGKKRAIYTLERGKPVRHPYSALAEDVAAARDRLRRWGVRSGTRVGIFAPNSYQWLVHDLVLIDIGAVSVPFTDDFAGKIDEALLARYDVALLLTVKSQARQFPAGAPHIVFMDADNHNVALRVSSVDPDTDALSLAFSSGSAGGLKGLVISREGVEATIPPIIEVIDARPDDRLLLFMPMSNFQQRNMCYAGLQYDFDVVISDYAQIFSAIAALNPTVLIAPPMYFQMVHTRFANLPAWKRHSWMALGALISLLPGAGLRRALARKAFPEFYRQFGSRMRLLITGMAPIKRSLSGFFDRMQLPLAESYGMVESGSLTWRPPGSKKYGSVGKPIRGVELEIASDGEIIVRRSRFLTKRYFQCADGENERTFVGPGMIATGDMGRFDDEGHLYLLGRKKELIVSPSGYKIHPEIIEEEMNACPDIAQSVVFARPGAAQLVAVVVLHQQETEELKARVKDHISVMKSTKKAMPIGEIIYADGPFSLQDGTLRPNLKLDRRGIAAKFQI